MKLKELFVLIYASILTLLLALGVVSILAFKTNLKLQESNSLRNKSISIANELKTSSEDLTRFCRTYAITGDSTWENKYWKTLDIRDGKKPRLDGRTISLTDSMAKLGFTKDELMKLKIAEENSNDLVYTEKVAFNAIKDLFADSSGLFRDKRNPDLVLARTILFDETYYYNKSTIMKPINEFILLIKQRTNSQVDNCNSKNKRYLSLIIGLIVIISLISISSIFIIKNKIIKQMNALKASENQLLGLNDTKDKLFSIIAHDLRSPFYGILGYSELLVENAKDFESEKFEKFLEIINSSVKNTLILLDNLLNWAKSQTGQVKLNPEKIVLSSIIKDVINISNSVAKIKNISINQIQSNELEISSDENMVRLILRNLISNAIKFTNLNGEINVSIITNHTHVEITVSDNGVGMSEEKCTKLFDINSHAITSGTKNEKGSGLGLMLCDEFVRRLGGNIWVKSELNKGSDFIFTLPLNKD